MTNIKKELVPSVTEMMEWTTNIFNQGIRRPGYSAGYKTEKWVKEHFKTMGLQNITLDPVPVKKWEAYDAKLKIWLIGNPNNILDIPCFPIPYTKPKDDLEAELSMITDETPKSGRILVSELELFKFPIESLKALSGVDRFYDPKNEFDTLEQTVPFDFKVRELFDPPLKNEAAGFIGILSGYPWETDEYYVPYDAIEREIPGVYVSRENGKKILKLIEKVQLKRNYHIELTYLK